MGLRCTPNQWLSFCWVRFVSRPARWEHRARERRRTIAGRGSASAEGTFIVRNVRLFDGNEVVDWTSVLVRDGKIAEVGVDLAAPAQAKVIEGAGRTLIPGLIDAHTHAFGDALARALVFGVTTELDMFTDHKMAAEWRTEQRTAGGAPARADIFSAGILVTAPGGHGTQFGMPIPTLTSPRMPPPSSTRGLPKVPTSSRLSTTPAMGSGSRCRAWTSRHSGP